VLATDRYSRHPLSSTEPVHSASTGEMHSDALPLCAHLDTLTAMRSPQCAHQDAHALQFRFSSVQFSSGFFLNILFLLPCRFRHNLHP